VVERGACVRSGGGELFLEEREIDVAAALGKDGGGGLDEHEGGVWIREEAAGERRGLRGAVAADELQGGKAGVEWQRGVFRDGLGKGRQ
jgi:hypothetical protein